MKPKLILTPQYYLFLDEESEIKEGDWFVNNHPNSYYIDTKAPVGSQRFANDSNAVFVNPVKIIAHLPKGDAPKLEGVDLLPELPSNEKVEILLKPEHIELLEQGNKVFKDNKIEYTISQKFINENGKWYIELPSNEEDVLIKKLKSLISHYQEKFDIVSKTKTEEVPKSNAYYSVDVDKLLANDAKIKDMGTLNLHLRNYEDLLTAAQAKKYSEEEVKNLLYNCMCYWFGRGILAQKENRISELKPSKDKINLKSFSTKKPKDFQIEIEEISDNKTNDFGKKQVYYQRPKVIAGVLQGKWIY